MFEGLSKSLQQAFKSISGKGKLTESNMRDGLRLIKESLLEADVSFQVVEDFMATVTEEALGEKVLLALKPAEHLIGIVRDKLVEVLGPVDPSLRMQADPHIFMMCGLQGSGKTTTCGKLAKHIIAEFKGQIKPLLVAADLQRPAAIDQLHVIGDQIGVPVYSDRGNQDPVTVCRNAVAKAKELGCNCIILDTAGRLAIDEELMQQLRDIDRRVGPHDCFLVVDGMTGQDAVNSAKAFHEALELNGVIMTKLDGDARGGALLSVKHVTGVPIKFIGVGETLDDLQPFRPEGMAGRILGHGDMLGLFDLVRKEVDEEEQLAAQKKMLEGEFTLEDFKSQLEKLAKPGLMQSLLKMLPGGGDIMKAITGAGGNAEGDANRMIAIINSMTPAERITPKLIDPSRRKRIAAGAGVDQPEVNQLVKQFEQFKPMMKSMAGMSGGNRMQAMQEIQKMAANPGGKIRGPKQSTGKRLSAAEKKANRKAREKARRSKKRRK